MSNLTDIQDAFSKHIVAPVSRFGLGGFIFDIESDATIDRRADITDNFVEDNTTIQDNIAIQPKRLTLRSHVGERFFFGGEQPLKQFQSLIQKLIVIDAFLPDLSASEEQFDQSITDQNGAVDTSDSSFDEILDIFALTINLNPAAGKIQQAYLYFEALFEKRILVSVLSPFGFFKSMAIESIQGKEFEISKDMATFSITLKEVRTASITTVAFDEKKFSGRNKQQRQPTTNQGKTNGKKSLLKTVTDVFF